MKFNVNEMVRFKPTEAGKKRYFDARWEIAQHSCGVITKGDCVLRVDEHGYSEMSLWYFMNIFGPMCVIGNREIPSIDNEIEIGK